MITEDFEKAMITSTDNNENILCDATISILRHRIRMLTLSNITTTALQ
jgi:hypothetical protein